MHNGATAAGDGLPPHESSNILNSKEMASAAVAMQVSSAAGFGGEAGQLVHSSAVDAAKDKRIDAAQSALNSLAASNGLDTSGGRDAATAGAAGAAFPTDAGPAARPSAASGSAAPSAPSTPPTPAAAHPQPATQPTPSRSAPLTLHHLAPDGPSPPPTYASLDSHPPTPSTSTSAPTSTSPPAHSTPIPASAPPLLIHNHSSHLIDAAVANFANTSGAQNYHSLMTLDPSAPPHSLMTMDPGAPPQAFQPPPPGIPQSPTAASAGAIPASSPDSSMHLGEASMLQQQQQQQQQLVLGQGGLAGLQGGPAGGGAMQQEDGESVQICFDFTKGACTRGSLCRYSHDVATIVQFNSREKGVCFDFLRNQCQRGLLCRFSHDVSNMAQQQQPAFTAGAKNRSTAICYDFVKGACVRGENCTFSHDLAMIARKAPRGRATRASEVCYDFLRGRCVRGMNCRFAHHNWVGYEAASGFPMAAPMGPPGQVQPPSPYAYPLQNPQYDAPSLGLQFAGSRPSGIAGPMGPPSPHLQPDPQKLTPAGMFPEQGPPAPHISALGALKPPQQSPLLAPSPHAAPQLLAPHPLGHAAPQQVPAFVPASATPRYSSSAISFPSPSVESPHAQLQPLSPAMTPTGADTPTALPQMLSRQSPLSIPSPVDPTSPTNPATLQQAMSSISLRSSSGGGALATSGFSSPTYPTAQRPHPFAVSAAPPGPHNPTRLMHQTGPNDLPPAAGAYPPAADPNPGPLRPLRTSQSAYPTPTSFTPTPTSSNPHPLLDPSFASGAATPSSPHLTPTFAATPSISTAQSILIAMHRQQQQQQQHHHHHHQHGSHSFPASVHSLGASLGNTPDFSSGPPLGTSLQPTHSGSSNPALPNPPLLEPQLSSQSWGTPDPTPAQGGGEGGWNPLDQARNMWSTSQLDGMPSPR